MIQKTFDEFVNEQTSQEAHAPFDKAKELDQWKRYTEVFYQSIELFLQKYIDDSKITLVYKTETLHEDLVGSYEVKALTISIGANQIRVKPIGMMLVGVKGRIDMIGSRGTVKFVLVEKNASAPKLSTRIWVKGEEPLSEQPVIDPPSEWTWKIATPPPKIKYIELEEESFYTAMQEVVNG